MPIKCERIASMNWCEFQKSVTALALNPVSGKGMAHSAQISKMNYGDEDKDISDYHQYYCSYHTGDVDIDGKAIVLSSGFCDTAKESISKLRAKKITHYKMRSCPECGNTHTGEWCTCKKAEVE